MIAVDTSALAAVILDEADARAMAERISLEDVALVGSPTAFELQLVIVGRLGDRARAKVNEFLASELVAVVQWEPRFVALAADAFIRYGKGRGHPAQLNFGDCMAYAISKAFDVPLLYKGGDFAHTDIRSALDQPG